MQPSETVPPAGVKDPDTPSGSPPEPSKSGSPAVDAVTVDGSGSPAPARLWALALGGAAVAGVVAWLIGEAMLPAFIPKPRAVQGMGVMLNLPTFADQAEAERKNATLAYVVLGAALGLALGMAGGLVRGSARRGMFAGITGALLGAIGGAVGSIAFLPIYFRQLDVAQEELGRDLIIPLLVHAGTWSAIGALAGSGLGLGLGGNRRLARAMLGGLIGGALGAVVYEVLGALAFPEARTTQPLALSWAPRLLAALSVSLFTALIAVSTVIHAQRRKAASPSVH